MCLNAKGGSGRSDGESETFVAHALDAFSAGRATEDGTGRGCPLVAMPILEAGARTGVSTDDPRAGIGVGEDGDPMFTLQAGKQHAVAFSCKDTGEDALDGLAPTLRAMNGMDGHANGGGQVAVALAGTLAANSGGIQVEQTYVPVNSAVRRLTPRECERLQGLPDDWTLVPWRSGMAADGPRYKAIGNGMAVNVVRWIGRRIEAVDGLADIA